MNLSRRRMLGWGTFMTASAASGLLNLTVRQAKAQTFGPLVPDSMFELPAGFSYKVLATTGDMLGDGNLRRGLPDGMAAFSGAPGQTILLLNHELNGSSGGVSRLVIDDETLEVVDSNDVLTGTTRNCAGGPSPWGWLSCEETAGGGVWLCPADANAVEPRKRIDDYGSFKHEAVCIDPGTLIAYLTEDDGQSHFYRMVPTDKDADPHSGQLQALKVKGQNDYDTAPMLVGNSVDVEWVDVTPATARDSAKGAGAAIIHRGEGIWFFDGEVYFTGTSHNQLFKFIPSPSGGALTLLANDLKSPDNITVAPWGDVFVAEDQSGYCRLRVVEPNGNVSDFGRNALAKGEELAGVCFSPDGKTLFVNLQKSGQTLAIAGPFPVVDGPPATGGSTGSGGSASGGPTGGASSAGASGSGNRLTGMAGAESDFDAGMSLGGANSSTGGAAMQAGCSCSQAGTTNQSALGPAGAVLLSAILVARCRSKGTPMGSPDETG